MSLKFRTLFVHTILTASLTSSFVPSVVHAETFPVITNKTVLNECGDCHMAFPPETLPKASWEHIIGNLEDHFGEDASLDADVTQKILTFHVTNASDVSEVRAAGKWSTTGTPKRLTNVERFDDKHGSCSDEVWTHEKIKSKSNCLACHKDMLTTGSTDADVGFLPKKLRRGCSWYNISDLMFWK